MTAARVLACEPLPILDAATAASRGLATTAQLAQTMRLSEHAMKRHAKADGFPPARATLARAAGRRPMLFDTAEVRAHLAPLIDAEDELRTSAPPRRVGTRVTTAGQHYVWRDARRYAPATNGPTR